MWGTFSVPRYEIYILRFHFSAHLTFSTNMSTGWCLWTVFTHMLLYSVNIFSVLLSLLIESLIWSFRFHDGDRHDMFLRRSQSTYVIAKNSHTKFQIAFFN